MTLSGRMTWVAWLGLVLFVASCLFYALLLLVPLLPISGSMKIASTPILITLGEATFWIGAAVVGKEVILRYRRRLNPRYWLFRRKEPLE